MKKNINFYDFCESFKRYGREEQFSFQAKELLFSYLEEINQEYELDIIALCCEWCEGDIPEGVSLDELQEKTICFVLRDGEIPEVLYRAF